jgi:hypothetical protein
MPNEHASTHAASSTITVFRTVEVAQDVPITLGEPLSPQAMALMKQVGPQRFQLNPGTYANAEEIDVQLGVGAAVQHMDFRYAAGTDYAAMVTQYEVEIGPPTSQHGGGEQVTVWKDDFTEFRLVSGSTGVHSRLSDLAPTAAHAKA